jgi:tetratricopeptide (TPR) repeat protein
MHFGHYLILTVGAIALTVWYWRELFDRGEERYTLRWFLTWAGKAVLFPVIAWIAINAGDPPAIPAIVHVEFPATAPVGFAALLFKLRYIAAQTAPALAVITTWWSALTLGTFVCVRTARSGDRDSLLASGIFWCLVLSPFVALLLWLYGLSALGVALLLWIVPLAQIATELKPQKTLPVYARAVASLKFGKYAQAEQAIIAELEKCESDFDGWLMLAGLYARQLQDVAEAARTIRGLCDDPNTTLAQMAIALNRLADWELELRADPAAARQALEEIIRRGPGTHLAHMAALRIKHLPASAEEWKDQHATRTVNLPVLGDTLDTASRPPATAAARIKSRDLANQCVQKLHENPADTPIREKLAHILADQLGELGLAIQQIEWLMEVPDQPPEKMAAWLALIAAWEIRRGENPQAVRQHLERLVREHPSSVHTLAARRRLELLDIAENPLPPETPAPARPSLRLST